MSLKIEINILHINRVKYIYNYNLDFSFSFGQHDHLYEFLVDLIESD